MDERQTSEILDAVEALRERARQIGIHLDAIDELAGKARALWEGREYAGASFALADLTETVFSAESERALDRAREAGDESGAAEAAEARAAFEKSAADYRDRIASLREESERTARTVAAARADSWRGKPFYTQKETARVLGVSAQTVARYTRAGILHAVRLGNRLAYQEADIDRVRREGVPGDYIAAAQKKNGRQTALGDLPPMERSPDLLSVLAAAERGLERSLSYCELVEVPAPFDLDAVRSALRNAATVEEARAALRPVVEGMEHVVLDSFDPDPAACHSS